MGRHDLKNHYTSVARTSVSGDGGFAVFNEIKLDGENYSAEGLTDALMMPPMMSEKKFIELSGFDIDAMKQDEFVRFCDTLELLNEYDFNVLILPVNKYTLDEGYLPKRPSARFSKLCEILTPVQFELLPPKKLSGWVKKHFLYESVNADDSVCDYMIEYCGRNMFVLKNEIEKLVSYLKSNGESTVTRAHVTGISVQGSEYGTFAFSNSILQGDAKTALEGLALYKQQKKDPTAVMGEVIKTCFEMLEIKLYLDSGLTSYEISKKMNLHEYAVGIKIKSVSKLSLDRMQKVIALCRDTDEKIKRSNLGYIAIERFICSL